MACSGVSLLTLGLLIVALRPAAMRSWWESTGSESVYEKDDKEGSPDVVWAASRVIIYPRCRHNF